MTDRDIRDLTKAIKDLGKIAAALNTTLVTMEQNRLNERSRQLRMCRVCDQERCTYGTVVDESMAKGCQCCGVNHEPQALDRIGS